jgi:DNA (cytosine-5)-methyltransferase 1|tara:strand:+ start:2284 stop:3138 length:855 start_codon:yes stop_codon:yes gene_type:complete
MIKIGSLFSGIGGFELGLERGIPGSRTVWQVEQNEFCQRVLRRHWPKAKLYNDIVGVGGNNLEKVDILCGGFPCQDLSFAGKRKGLDGKKSGLWWEMWRVISELRPRVVCVENVTGLFTLGIREILGSLAEIGYDAEWQVISAAQCGAPHRRNRVFIVAYTSSNGCGQARDRGIVEIDNISSWTEKIQYRRLSQFSLEPTNTNKTSAPGVRQSIRVEKKRSDFDNLFYTTGFGYWQKTEAPAPICRVDDGIPNRLAKLRALGNSIVPQCTEWIGRRIMEAGLLC